LKSTIAIEQPSNFQIKVKATVRIQLCGVWYKENVCKAFLTSSVNQHLRISAGKRHKRRSAKRSHKHPLSVFPFFFLRFCKEEIARLKPLVELGIMQMISGNQ
jgi:hypothetical protein